MTSDVRTDRLFAVRVHNASYQQMLAAALAAADDPLPAYTTYSHFNVLLSARRQDWLRALLNNAALNVGDGIAVRWALRGRPGETVARVNATDFHHLLLEETLRSGRRLYLLGGSESAARTLPAVLEARFPGCTVRAHHGRIAADDAAVREDIRRFAPDVLMLGLGIPLQFSWMRENLSVLSIPLTSATGNFLEFLAGTQPRAPRWMRTAGLEWLHRVALEPRRLWRRYLLGIPRFVILVILERLARRG